MRPSAGFSLIELVIVMIIISAGVLGLTGLFGNASTSLSSNEAMQRATQSAQECAEAALAIRRSQGFSWFANHTFSCTTPDSNGFARTNNPVGATYLGTASSTDACPDGTTCRDVSISVTSDTTPAVTASITLMLVDGQ
jgi:prepilin-type N-terminal cleavage/methylation domain-containing protein